MHRFGRFLLLVGIVWLIVALNMDTSVSSVHNIGLISSKQNHVIIGCFIILYGLLVTLFYTKKD